jgi:hypothetical protein
LQLLLLAVVRLAQQKKSLLTYSKPAQRGRANFPTLGKLIHPMVAAQQESGSPGEPQRVPAPLLSGTRLCV